MPKGLYEHKRKCIEYYVDENGCHICTSHSLTTDGYPQIQVESRRYNLHRYLFEQAHGKIDRSVFIRHTCDNRLCINLEHMIPGTPKQNSQDMVERGRSARGMSVYGCKLNEQIVSEIRKSELSCYKLAKKYSVSRQLIGQIKSRKIWKHIPEVI